MRQCAKLKTSELYHFYQEKKKKNLFTLEATVLNAAI